MAGYGEEGFAPSTVPGAGGSSPLTIKTFTSSGTTSQKLNLTQKVGSTDVALFSADEDKGKSVLPAARHLTFNNVGESALGVSVKLDHWSSGTAIDVEPNKYIHFVLARNESFDMPITRMIVSDNSAIDAGTSVSNTAPNSNMYVDSGALTTEGFADDNDTTITFDDGSAGAANNFFRVGDLIRLDDEICEVREIVDTAADGDYTPANFVVDRGVYGTTKADHTNNTAIRLPFFNAYADFDKFSTARTDHDGRYKAFNYFGLGRTATVFATGILPGSVAIKCYQPGYQELGISGVSPGVSSGLATSTAYQFNITVDGSGAFSLSFTTSASNVNWGGRDGILKKIQDVLDQQFYTAGNMFEERVTVNIVDGDVRFTSGSYLSTSAILLEDSSGSDTDIWGVGRFPAAADCEKAVAARLPDDTISDPITGESISNRDAFLYDDSKGSLIGKGSGSINYNSGEIDFISYPNSEFVISAIHTSALSGHITETSNNTIQEIKVRSMNTKVDGKINLVVEG